MRLTLQWSMVTSRWQEMSLHLSHFFKFCKVQKQQQEGLQGNAARTTTQDTVKWGNSTGQAKSSLGWKKSLRWIHGRKVHQGLPGRKAQPLVSQVIKSVEAGTMHYGIPAINSSLASTLGCCWKLQMGPNRPSPHSAPPQSPWYFCWLKACVFSPSYHCMCYPTQQAVWAKSKLRTQVWRCQDEGFLPHLLVHLTHTCCKTGFYWYELKWGYLEPCLSHHQEHCTLPEGVAIQHFSHSSLKHV